MSKHRAALRRGAGAAAIVVACRLALPWPFKALLAPWMNGHTTSAKSMGWLSSGVSLAVAVGAVLVTLLAVLGLADYLERLYFARFSAGIARDMRAAALATALHSPGAPGRARQPGDIVARLTGDCSRVKSGLRGMLVHVVPNGLHLVGVTLVLLWVSPTLGLIFACAVAAIGTTTWLGAEHILQKAARARAKEGKLAQDVHDTLRERATTDDLDGRLLERVEGRGLAGMARIQGTTTWVAHCLFGVGIFGALWLGAAEVQARTLGAHDLLLFVMYALTARAPVVQLARQGSRIGKVLASAERVGALIGFSVPAQRVAAAAAAAAPATAQVLTDSLRLEQVTVKGGRRRGATLLGPLDLAIHAGEKVLVLGRPGAGKTLLVELLAGLREPSAGRITWDGVPAGSRPALAASALAQEAPFWRKRSTREWFDLGQDGPRPEQQAVLLATGAEECVARLPNGLDSVVGSRDLSFGEGKALSEARALLSQRPLCLLDGVSAGRALRYAALQNIGRTLVVTSGDAASSTGFDRVIELDQGRAVWTGPASEWTQRLEARDALAAPERMLTRGTWQESL